MHLVLKADATPKNDKQTYLDSKKNCIDGHPDKDRISILMDILNQYAVQV